MELEGVVEALCTRLPEAIGAILCDSEGEAVVHAIGAADPPDGAERNAESRIPRSFIDSMSLREFLLRVSGAEPCPLLQMFRERSEARGFGPIAGLDLSFGAIELLVRCLPDDYYLMLALRRPTIRARAVVALDQARAELAAF